MNEKQIPADLARLVKAMQQHPADTPVGRVLANLLPDADEALAWLERQQRRAALPVVFAFDIPGFVLIGPEDNYKTVPAPDKSGVYAAWEIFLHGDNAPFVSFSDDLGVSPNSLRNSLEPAAAWVEYYSASLAVAIRAISIRKDGSATFDPAYVPPLRLNVFSTCAAPLPRQLRGSIGVSNWTKEPHHEHRAEDRQP